VVCEVGDDADHDRLLAAIARATEKEIGFSPSRVILLSARSIPRTTNGKTQHHALREALMNGDLEQRRGVRFKRA
jgi:acyl-coenzyme A synthetase/AMP-(fatty) acid ligase